MLDFGAEIDNLSPGPGKNKETNEWGGGGAKKRLRFRDLLGTDTGKTGEPAAVRTMLAGRSESRIRNAAEDQAISSRTLRYGGKRLVCCAVPGG